MGRGLPPRARGGHAPIRQSTEPDELAEERRLLYVGITRARRYLWLSWATTRTGATGREGRRSRSRFLDGLVPATAGRGGARRSGGGPRQSTGQGRTRLTGRRSRMRSVPGGRPAPAPMPWPRSSSSTTRRSRRSRQPAALDRGASPRPGVARRSSTAMARLPSQLFVRGCCNELWNGELAARRGGQAKAPGARRRERTPTVRERPSEPGNARLGVPAGGRSS